MLVDARTAKVTAAPELPWYLTALLVSQPLHFGDYAGMPMQILWAVLDIATILVLGSGLYLWVARRRTQPQGAAAAARQEGPGSGPAPQSGPVAARVLR